jgi:hypothetical protein
MTDRGVVDRIARAVLYEGYSLYPYRPSAIKNRQPFTFGALYPEGACRGGSDRSWFQMECLAMAGEAISISVVLRFLSSGQEREIVLEWPRQESVAFSTEDSVDGRLSAGVAAISPGIFKVTVKVQNTTAAAERDSEFGAAHAIVTIAGGEFISMTDPPEALRTAAAQCVNAGVWPVLAGERGPRNTVLASPIILPDYPETAPESCGDLNDATEIEEILMLRILTLTDEEKAEVRASGGRAKAILERAESLPAERLMELHGAVREWTVSTFPAVGLGKMVAQALACELQPGDRVRIRPRKRADIFDSLLEGRVAIIDAVERDFENKLHVAVVVEDDPGRDFGEMRQAGHRFFYAPDELEWVGPRAEGSEAHA